MDPLLVSGENLRIDDVVAVAAGRPVALDPAAVPRMERSRAAVERLVAEVVAFFAEPGYAERAAALARYTEARRAAQRRR